MRVLIAGPPARRVQPGRSAVVARGHRPGADRAVPLGLPPIGLPLPPIGLPLATLGLPPAAPTPTTTPSAINSARPHRGGGDARRRHSGPGAIYVIPAYGWSVTAGTAVPGLATPPAATPAPALPAPAIPAAGTLRLELQPRPTGQLFVDGAYVGTLDDLGTELVLLAGIRQLEIRQPGYLPFTLTARIDDGRALTYRGELQPAVTAQGAAIPVATAPETPAPPIPRKPLYYIPGCYLGDVAPQDAALPPTCDVSRAVTFRP